MPLYMDRHELPGASAADVAEAHAKDLEVQGKYGVQFLSYWFEPDHGGVFCLARAADAERMAAVHSESHGLVPNEIIEVSEDAILRFLGDVHEPADASEVTSAFRTILFTDIEGSTALAARLDASDYLSLVREHDTIVRRAVVSARGREVKHTGDGLMASFEEVGDALTCALSVQAGFASRNAEGRSPSLRVRVGLDAGEPVDHNDDLFGATVSRASRLCEAADPGRTLVSQRVRELGEPHGFAFADAGERTLKGFDETVRAFELIGRREG